DLLAAVAILRTRPRRPVADRLDQVTHAEIAQRRTEINRRQVTLTERSHVERTACFTRQIDLLDESLAVICGQQASDLVRFRTVDGDRLNIGIRMANGVVLEVIGAREVLAESDRPINRRGIERQLLLDLVQDLERIAALAVELVDEGDDRDIAQAADFEQLQRSRLDTS